MNLNIELFKRYKPEKKLDIINSCCNSDFLNIRKSTILRMIKEAGAGDSKKARNKFKDLRLEFRVGNNWNSEIEKIYNWKKDEIFLDVYIQGDDTDTVVSCSWDDFADFKYEEVCLGKLKESFRTGYEHTIPANYNKEDRALVIKEICKSYIKYKYNI